MASLLGSELADSASELNQLGRSFKALDAAAAAPEATQAAGIPEDSPLTPEHPAWHLHEPALEVDARDASTADRWIARRPENIRLTGRHPYNCEPPLPLLMSKGFLTPVGLHYVRNHGAVPQLSWEGHRLTIGGMVDRPAVLTMHDLTTRFEIVTLPVTLVCAGNRRKEQNLVKRSKGFNWGPTATSTGLWTGVRLADVLRWAGAASARAGARHVCFRGPVGELPQGKDGSYGTSLKYHVAMDPANDILLAFAHNGRRLTPDHGFPLRILIPGFIGGRSVKWLEEITVSAVESDNFYHYKDNRVLPPDVDHERAEAEGWWYRPEFIINELNINSIISTPGHQEVVPLAADGLYTLRGYAYSGGGRAVIRVEVSLDGGEHWRLADIERPSEPTEYGKHWCWMFWSLGCAPLDLLRASELRCRAVDESNNLQPDKLTWNVMGMMNNPHYRVRVHPHALATGGLALQFEHPTKSGSEAGGWMEREVAGREEAVAPVPPPTAAAAPAEVEERSLRVYSMQEVEKHASHESAWFVHDGRVYDATKFLKAHPGGAESILIVAGQDATDEFNAIHSERAKGMLKEYCIGRVGETGPPDAAEAHAPEQAEAGSELVALNPRKKVAFRLVERTALTHNTRRLRFALQSPQHRLGLPVGQHMFFYAKDKGELVMRAYTPTSSDDDLGYFDLVIKVYFANQHPQFPLGGRLSQYLERMAVGDSIEVKGPLGHFVYRGRGAYVHHGRPGAAAALTMVAGGTGITPCYQVIQAVLKDPKDRTRMRLIFCNQTEDDVLLKPELDAFAKDDRLEVLYMLSRPATSWAGAKGRVCQAVLQQHGFPAGAPGGALALLCGPPGMIEQACVPALTALGYTEDTLVIF